jgi:SAM-dependent methyltransferase
MDQSTSVTSALLVEFLRIYPFQPATAWWRAIEIAHLLHYRLPVGLCIDVGCGDGLLTRLIESHASPAVRTWVGIDPDPAEVVLAKQCNLYAEVFTSTADRINQPDCRFDLALANSVLEHIAEVESVLHEVARILKPNAPFVFTVPSASFHDCLRGPSPLRRTVLRQGREQYLKQVDQRLAHVYYWDEERWRRALRTAGFDQLEFSSYLSAPEVQRWETLSNLTAGVLYELFRHRPPIEIQRSLGMRRSRSMPQGVARVAAALLSAGVRTTTSGPTGGLMVVAHRRAAHS